jgi:hypothetical protein
LRKILLIQPFESARDKAAKVSNVLGETFRADALALLLVLSSLSPLIAAGQTTFPKPPIERLDPPEKQFFSKMVSFCGIPIKAHEVVVDEALYAAFDRLAMELKNQPMVISNLVAAGVELHIIGRNQVTTDLPEWQHDKGKPIYEPTYNGMTRDERTRGMGGRFTSCGEENLLRLEKDRYHGRDICLHEFAHAIRNFGLTKEVRTRFDDQYKASLAKGYGKVPMPVPTGMSFLPSSRCGISARTATCTWKGPNLKTARPG